MNILDVIIIIFVLFGAVIGFKRGFTKELLEAVGFILVIVLAYFLKNPLSVFMYEHLPFFEFGILKNVEVLNILIYEGIAFFICVVVLSLVLKILLVVTSIFEKMLSATIILSIPSKIAGAFVGLLHYFVIVFIILYIVSLTVFDVDFINDSKLKSKILNNTPLLSQIADKGTNVIEEFIALKDEYQDENETEFRYKAIELFLKYDVITEESLQKLFDEGKIEKFDGYSDLLKENGGESQNGN